MKDRVLDTLKLIGICIAFIAFFAFLAASCEDKEDRAERYAAQEELREQIWDEAFQEGFESGVESGYESGYDAGYDKGYETALGQHSESGFRQAPSSDDFPVYISSSFTMHKKSNCSGMKNYIEMPYSVASQYYSKKCGNCFK